MRFKRSPEDFIVKELLPDDFIKPRGKCLVFALIKKGVTTTHCLRVIAREFGLRFNDIGYCGLKDKHAKTTQYLTVTKGHEFRTKNFKLKKMGYSNQHLQRGDNVGNEFIITAQVTPEERELIKHNEIIIRRRGFINLFGRQRSREIKPKSFTHFLLQGDYQTTLIRYYINKKRLSRGKLKKAYQKCFKQWPDAQKCYQLLKGMEKNITLKPLKVAAETNDFLKAIKSIPKSELELLIAGYQSLLWNERVLTTNKEVLELPIIKVPAGLGVKARTGSRRVRVKPGFLKISYSSDEVLIHFTLPSGSYATVLLRKLVSPNLSRD